LNAPTVPWPTFDRNPFGGIELSRDAATRFYVMISESPEFSSNNQALLFDVIALLLQMGDFT
jgi:hypothetical protein